MTVRQNVTFEIGATWQYVIACYDGFGSPLQNIQEAEWRLASSTERFVLASIANGMIVAAANVLTMTVPIGSQSGVAASNYSHELWALDGSDVGSIQVAGSCTILQTLKNEFP